MVSPEVAQKAYAVLQDIRRRDEYGAGYDFETLGEFFGSEDHEKSWIIKGIIAWGETTAWIGPPGSLKSALMSDLAISVAYNRNWHGQKYRSYGDGVSVLYFALERSDLVKRRLEAQAKTLGLALEKGSSIVVVPGIIELTTPEGVKKAATTLKNVESFTGDMIGFVIFDTHAKLIAAAGGDEDKAKEQGRLFTGIERFKEMTGRPHVALVGHTGKDETRGARGSNALYGDVDVLVTMSGEEIPPPSPKPTIFRKVRCSRSSPKCSSLVKTRTAIRSPSTSSATSKLQPLKASPYRTEDYLLASSLRSMLSVRLCCPQDRGHRHHLTCQGPLMSCRSRSGGMNFIAATFSVLTMPTQGKSLSGFRRRWPCGVALEERKASYGSQREARSM